MKPLEISLFERPGTGRSSRLSSEEDEDEDGGGGGADSISGRFRQRLVELTGEANLAAEEEARFLRHVEANMAAITTAAEAIAPDNGASGSGTSKGGNIGTRKREVGIGKAGAEGPYEALALAAAREWRFVSTDSRLRRSSSISPGGSANNNPKPARCWYRAETREYFWGDNPPLVGLFLRLGDDWPWKKDKNRPNDARGDDSQSATGSSLGFRISEDGETAPTGVVHPELGLVFEDRASGESWLKAQDLELLLARSEKLRDVGPAGWGQLRAGGGDVPTAVASTVEPAVPSGSSVATAASAMTVPGAASGTEAAAGSGGNNSHAGGNNLARDDRQAAAANAGAGAGPEADHTVAQTDPPAASQARKGAALVHVHSSGGPPPQFTFFHHPDMGEVRWCLSPRSALLATPRTPRREAAEARNEAAAAAAAAAADHGELQPQQGWYEEGTEERNDDVGDGTLALVEAAASGDWEVVEDGDMVFYYNKSLGISTWEPPPGWEESGSQETYGAGG